MRGTLAYTIFFLDGLKSSTSSMVTSSEAGCTSRSSRSGRPSDLTYDSTERQKQNARQQVSFPTNKQKNKKKEHKSGDILVSAGMPSSIAFLLFSLSLVMSRTRAAPPRWVWYHWAATRIAVREPLPMSMSFQGEKRREEKRNNKTSLPLSFRSFLLSPSICLT